MIILGLVGCYVGIMEKDGNYYSGFRFYCKVYGLGFDLG